MAIERGARWVRRVLVDEARVVLDLVDAGTAVVAGHVVEEKGVLVTYGRGCCPGGGGCGKRAGGGTFVCGEEAGTRKRR